MNDVLVLIVSEILRSLRDKEQQDAFIDMIEDWIDSTETKLDDDWLLPMLKAYRTAANVPDND